MEPLTCKMCGSSSFKKENGLYVCEYCGTAYVQDSDENWSAKPGTTAAGKNFYVLAQTAFEAKNYEEAEKYANKVLEINSENADAWYIKGVSAGWQSTTVKPRIDELRSSLDNAIKFSNGEITDKAHESFKTLCTASINLALSQYQNYPDYDTGVNLLAAATLRVKDYSDFCQKYSFEDAEDFSNSIANLLFASISNSKLKIISDYQGLDNHPTDFDLELYVKRLGYELRILDLAIELDVKKDNILKCMVYSSKIEILTLLESAKSYKIGSGGTWDVSRSFTDEAKEQYIDQIMETHKAWNAVDPAHVIPERPKKSSNGCYIATAVYGSYDCPEVWVLRRFRDDVLYRNLLGRIFIKIYYALSPKAVEYFGKYRLFNRLFKAPLDKFVSHLMVKGFEDIPYKDRY